MENHWNLENKTDSADSVPPVEPVSPDTAAQPDSFAAGPEKTAEREIKSEPQVARGRERKSSSRFFGCLLGFLPESHRTCLPRGPGNFPRKTCRKTGMDGVEKSP